MEKMDLKYDYEEALKRQNFDQSQVDALRVAVEKCDELPKLLTDKLLLLSLNRARGDIEKAVKVLKKNYEIRRKNPQIFAGRDVSLPELQQCVDNQFYINLPVTKDYNLVALHGFTNPIAKNFIYDPAAKTFLMMTENLIYKHGPSNGLILLFDMENFRMGHLTRNNLKSLRAFFNFIQEGFLAEFDKIHVFNTFPAFQLVMKLIKPFLNAEVVQKMNLHPSSLDLQQFYAEHVARSSLPSDYGGVCGTIEELNKQNTEELLEMRKYFEYEEKQWNI